LIDKLKEGANGPLLINSDANIMNIFGFLKRFLLKKHLLSNLGHIKYTEDTLLTAVGSKFILHLNISFLYTCLKYQLFAAGSRTNCLPGYKMPIL